MLGTWLERGGEGVEGVDRSLEGSQLQSPLVLLLLLQLEDMAGASFQTSLLGSGEEEEEEGQVLSWDTGPGMGGTWTCSYLGHEWLVGARAPAGWRRGW